MANSWKNGTSRAITQKVPKRNWKISYWKGLVVCGVVIMLGVTILFYLQNNGNEKLGEDDTYGTKNYKLKDSEIIPSNRVVRIPFSNKNTNIVKKYVFNPKNPPPGLKNGLAWDVTRKKDPKIEYYMYGGTNRVKSVYRNATEQTLISIFSCELGDPPPPLGELPMDEKKNLINILNSPIVDSKDDGESQKLDKEILRDARAELKKYIKGGGDVQTFFTHYRNILATAYEKRVEASKMIEQICNEQDDPLLARDFARKVNDKLRAEGIKPVGVPLSMVNRIKSIKQQKE